MSPAATRAYARAPYLCAVAVAAAVALAGMAAGSASAATPTTINLATSGFASVLAGAGVTNTGPSILNRDLDTWPTPAITGFPAGIVLGATNAANGVAKTAQSDLTTAYNAAAGAPSTSNETGVDLGGMTLTQGVYTASSSMAVTGPLPLTLNGSASSVFIFQAGTTLTTGSNSSIVLTGGVSACNIFWQVGSSATIGTNTTFVGNILALTSISVTTGATVQGRALARNGAVTLDDNVFSGPACTSAVNVPRITPVVVKPKLTPPPAGSTVTTPTPKGTVTSVAPVSPTPTPIVPLISTTSPTTVAPSGTATPTSPSTASPGGGGATTSTATTLAFTGMRLRPLLEVASLMLLVGTAAVAAGRRRRAAK